MSRQQAKQRLRKISEYVIRGILGGVPRNLRRAAGRQFANESWRYLQGLDKYDSRINNAAIRWVADEFRRLNAEKDKGNDRTMVLPAGGSENPASEGSNREASIRT